jgi:hypothetical protein
MAENTIYSKWQKAFAVLYFLLTVVTPISILIWYLITDSNMANQLPTSWIIGVCLARLWLLAPIVRNKAGDGSAWAPYYVFQFIWMLYGFILEIIIHSYQFIPLRCFVINFWSMYIDSFFIMFSYKESQESRVEPR